LKTIDLPHRLQSVRAAAYLDAKMPITEKCQCGGIETNNDFSECIGYQIDIFSLRHDVALFFGDPGSGRIGSSDLHNSGVKMMKTKLDGYAKFKKLPFSILIKKEKELLDLRKSFALKSKSERRFAADWEYQSEIAGEVFNNALTIAGEVGFGKSYWPSGIIPLAIDPLYAPAILTVGSIEYQVGRIEEAMNLFLKLTELPEDEEDLSIIIDKAGDFLIDNNDMENALVLYSAAEKAYPNDSLFLIGSGFCLGKLGDFKNSIEKHRRAVALEPNNYKHLNELGFSLMENCEYEEAEEILNKSIALSPDEYEFPRNNLKELINLKKKK
jgi:tetratricopeptide (TPR) repeat protein